MNIHQLKCEPKFYQAIKNGEKTFEIRINDRDFQRFDLLELAEYDDEQSPPQEAGIKEIQESMDKMFGKMQWHDYFTGRKLIVEVTYLTEYKQMPGFIVMAIRRIAEDDPRIQEVQW